LIKGNEWYESYKKYHNDIQKEIEDSSNAIYYLATQKRAICKSKHVPLKVKFAHTSVGQ